MWTQVFLALALTVGGERILHVLLKKELAPLSWKNWLATKLSQPRSDMSMLASISCAMHWSSSLIETKHFVGTI